MADISADTHAPPSLVEEMVSEDAPGITHPEGPIRGKRRQRLLQGIQRISSSSSLRQSKRSGSSRSPYAARGSLSCVSLSGNSPFAQYPSGTSSPGYLAHTSPGTPTTEFPGFGEYETRLAVRKLAHGSSPCLAPSSIALPADFVATRSRSGTTRKPLYDFWANMPDEIRVQILSYLEPKELVRISILNKEFHSYCFDGQLWTNFDASDFYQDIPAESLAKIITAAGPFIKDLNLRGCVQVEHEKKTEVVVKACQNLINATLEGCRNLPGATLHSLIKTNQRLTNLNLTGLPAVSNSTCKIVSQHCPQLETFNVSWCKSMDAKGIRMVVLGCPKLRDLRAGEIRGFDNLDVAKAIFETNSLERLVLSGCTELNDEALRTMMHGIRPSVDILTDRPIVPVRKLRHLDLSRCKNLTNHGVEALAHLLPELEGLRLSGCSAITDSALELIVASTPHLTHLELEDLTELTNGFLSKHLAKAPCAPKLEHLSVGYCENISDTGMIPVLKNCTSLKNIEMDNTRIGDLVLAEASAMVRSRAARSLSREARPYVGLRLVVYDCSMVSWTGIREVLSWNAEIRGTTPTYPTEIIGLKCLYSWQQTVDQHTQRVLRGDFLAAGRLERKWADYMQAIEEAGAGGAGIRRRRRRAREAQQLHADEEGAGAGRRRARTMASSCAIM
ncbi:F-box domain-containing protein [Apiospora saccharicola]|uniref:F-box domain-containing protein n=1 Tax=Apiospora saccharicola TaxID=335842 RepID=A0ABR1WNG4_9PEZI